MNGPDEHLSPSAIAAATGVTLSAISNWRKRHQDFPRADTVAGQDVFRTEEVLNWLGNRRIPANARKPGEGPGTTYRDRMLRAFPGGQPEAVDWAPSLWSAFDLLRVQHGPADSVRLLLGLLYVRTRESSLWHALAREPDPVIAWRQLGAVALRAGVGARPVPVFPTVDQASGPGPSLSLAIRILDRIDLTRSITGEMCDALLDRVVRDMGSRAGRYTPVSLVRLMVELADPRSTDEVLDPYCGSGEFLSGAFTYARHAAGLRLHAQPPNDDSWRTAMLSSALHDIPVQLSEPGLGPYDDRFPGRQFDLVLLNPPFNQRQDMPAGGRWPFGEPPAHNANFAWLQRAVTKLKPGGRAVVLTANGATSSRMAAEAGIRRAMVDAGVIECVVALPDRLFRSTAIPVTLWVLRGLGAAPPLGQVLFADARALGTMTDRVERVLTAEDIQRIVAEYRGWRDHLSAGPSTMAEFATAVPYSEIREHDYCLNPGEYVSATVVRQEPGELRNRIEAARQELADLRVRAERTRSALEQQLEASLSERRLPRVSTVERRVTSLGNVVDLVFGPARIPKNDLRPKGTPVVMARNVRPLHILAENLAFVAPSTAESLVRFRLRVGDVVGVRTGSLGRYAQVTSEEAGWLLGPGCVLLRPEPDVDPDYLAYLLNGPAARRWLRERVTSSAIEHVTSATLRRLPLALPDRAAQQEIVAVLGALDAEAKVHEEIRVAEQMLRDLLLPILMEPDGGLVRPTR